MPCYRVLGLERRLAVLPPDTFRVFLEKSRSAGEMQAESSFRRVRTVAMVNQRYCFISSTGFPIILSVKRPGSLANFWISLLFAGILLLFRFKSLRLVSFRSASSTRV